MFCHPLALKLFFQPFKYALNAAFRLFTPPLRLPRTLTPRQQRDLGAALCVKALKLFCEWRGFLFRNDQRKTTSDLNETVTIATALPIMRKLSQGPSTFVRERQQDEKMGVSSFDFRRLNRTDREKRDGPVLCSTESKGKADEGRLGNTFTRGGDELCWICPQGVCVQSQRGEKESLLPVS